MRRIRHDTLKEGPQIDVAEYRRLAAYLETSAGYEVGSGRLPEEWEAAGLMRRMWTRIRWLECELDEARKDAARAKRERTG